MFDCVLQHCLTVHTLLFLRHGCNDAVREDKRGPKWTSHPVQCESRYYSMPESCTKCHWWEPAIWPIQRLWHPNNYWKWSLVETGSDEEIYNYVSGSYQSWWLLRWATEWSGHSHWRFTRVWGPGKPSVRRSVITCIMDLVKIIYVLLLSLLVSKITWESVLCVQTNSMW